MKRYVSAVLAYLVPTFGLGFVWHLVLFQSYYEALAMYRRDIIIPSFSEPTCDRWILPASYSAGSSTLRRMRLRRMGDCVTGSPGVWRSRNRTLQPAVGVCDECVM